MLTLTYEFKILPTSEQTVVIEQYLEICRKVWNYALRERKDWINSRKCAVNACSITSEYIIPASAPYPTYQYQAKQLTEAKKTNVDLTKVNAQVLQQVLRRLEGAFIEMYERGFGFPRFKKFGRMRSFVFPQFKANPFKRDLIKLPALGWTRMILSRPIPESFKLKQARIVKKASGYFIMLSLQCDLEVPLIQPHGHPLGIDLGLEKFAATSDGELIPRPRFLSVLHRQIKLLQRRLKHKKKGSKNWRKLSQKIARLHQRINDTRKDFHFKLAHHLCNQAGSIFVEDLNLKAMSRGMYAAHTLDAAFGQFLNILQWVCWKRQVYFAKVDPNATSQVCPMCEAHTPKDLSVRVHKCPECHYVTDRDVAAAQVVVIRGVQNIAAGQAVNQNVCGDGLPGTPSTGKSRRGRKLKR